MITIASKGDILIFKDGQKCMVVENKIKQGDYNDRGQYHSWDDSRLILVNLETADIALHYRYNIPYDDLDPQMINLIYILNFKIGLKTKFCCYGHRPFERINLMFHEDVNDKEDLLMELTDLEGRDFMKLRISFQKWIRCSPVMVNWSLDLDKGFRDPNSKEKFNYLKDIEQFFESYAKKISNNI